MSKTTTLKDVLYALEYLGSTLTRHPAQMKAKGYWTLANGVKVPEAISREAIGSGSVALVHETREGVATYGWRKVAA